MAAGIDVVAAATAQQQQQEQQQQDATERVAVYLPHVLRQQWSTAVLPNVFDEAMARMMEAHAPVPFAHGCAASDPALTITGLHQTHYLLLKAHLESYGGGVQLADVRPDDMLIQSFNFSHTRAFIFPSYESLTVHTRQEQYHNKKVVQARRREKTLEHARGELAQLRALCQQRAKFIAMDIEAYEFNHNVITEVGFTTAEPQAPTANDTLPPAPFSAVSLPGDSVLAYKLSSHHILVSENMAYHNGVRVADNKFAFHGESVVLSERSALQFLAAYLSQADVVVGHALQSDVQLLRRRGFRLLDGKVTLDTQTMWKAARNNIDNVRLSSILDACAITYSALHNAGNDARYTMEAALRIASLGDTASVPTAALLSPSSAFGKHTPVDQLDTRHIVPVERPVIAVAVATAATQ
ncbi:hypothetical protein RI367_002024 [Sorochytrium milnesiophthora]